MLVRRLAKSLQVRARLTRDVSVRCVKIVVRISVGTSAEETDHGCWMMVSGILPDCIEGN